MSTNLDEIRYKIKNNVNLRAETLKNEIDKLRDQILQRLSDFK